MSKTNETFVAAAIGLITYEVLHLFFSKPLSLAVVAGLSVVTYLTIRARRRRS